MFDYQFTKTSLKRFKKLPKDIQIRIIKKIGFFLSQPDPLIYAEVLTNSRIGKYRFRIGDYRVVFDLEEEEIIMVLDIDHRKDIYK